MAIMTLQENMVFWEIKVAGVAQMTPILSHVVAGFNVVYQINEPTTAAITIISNNYVENLFTMNQKIEINMGFDRTDLVPMFSGTIKLLPKGSAADALHYVVEAVGDEVNLSLVSKNAIHSNMTKKQIIETLCIRNGFTPEVSIKDAAPLTAQSVPIQANKTDFEFLKECAAKWGCDFWFSDLDEQGMFCFFFDHDLAYNEGNFRQKPNPNDFKKSDYVLGYRTDSTRNNVAKVTWKFRAPKGGGDGTPSHTGTDETGDKETKRKYTISYKQERWQLKEPYLSEVKASNQAYKKYYGAVRQTGIVVDAETNLRKYFRKITMTSKEHEYKNPGKSTHLTVDLNIGDPWLRPPRTVKLFHGSEDPRAVSSHLPIFLWEKEEESAFLLQKVTTSLTAGKITTKLEMQKA